MTEFTKRELGNSLKTLLQDRPLNRITVADITGRCGVNRQTFYYHFKNIYELLGWIYTTEALGTIENCKSYETWQEGLSLIFSYVRENRPFCLNTYRSLGREHLENFLNQTARHLLMAVLEEIPESAAASEETKEFIVNYHASGFTSLLLEWLKEGTDPEPSQIVGKLSRLMEGHFAMALSNLSS